MGDKQQNAKNVHRYRDIVMRWQRAAEKEMYLVILACETQSKVHYAMPIRGMVYDGLIYLEQSKYLWEQHQNQL